MRLKSFHAGTMSDAMRQVRDALGPDAIIVATRNDPDGVRITAAIEEPDSAPPPAAPPAADSLDAVVETLLAHGTPARLAEAIAIAAAPHRALPPLQAMEAALAARFRFDPLGTRPDRPLLLCGPPGAGKTLAAAKIAARAALAGARPGLIGADDQRAGANDALGSLARIMGAGFASVDDPDALPGALSSLIGLRPLIVDTAGRNAFDADDMQELRGLITQAVEPALTLAAGGDAEESGEIAAAFVRLGCRRLIATRLDATRRLGGLLAAADAGLAFAEAAGSPRAADGLAPFSAAALARMLMPKEAP